MTIMILVAILVVVLLVSLAVVYSMKRKKKFRHHSLIEQYHKQDSRSKRLDLSSLVVDLNREESSDAIEDVEPESGVQHGGQQERHHQRRHSTLKSRNRRKSRKVHRGSQEKEVYYEEE